MKPPFQIQVLVENPDGVRCKDYARVGWENRSKPWNDYGSASNIAATYRTRHQTVRLIDSDNEILNLYEPA